MDNLFYRKVRKGIDPRELLRKLLRNKQALLGLIVGLPLSMYILFGSRGIVQRFKLQDQKIELTEKVAEAMADSVRLRAESRALDGDRKAIEKVAREKHGMIREGETVYKVRKK
jgi:cell division protein FtsB